MNKKEIEKTANAIVDKWVSIERYNKINYPDICQPPLDDIIYFRELAEKLSERNEYKMARFLSDRDFDKTYHLSLSLFLPAFMRAM